MKSEDLLVKKVVDTINHNPSSDNIYIFFRPKIYVLNYEYYYLELAWNLSVRETSLQEELKADISDEDVYEIWPDANIIARDGVFIYLDDIDIGEDDIDYYDLCSSAKEVFEALYNIVYEFTVQREQRIEKKDMATINKSLEEYRKRVFDMIFSEPEEK